MKTSAGIELGYGFNSLPWHSWCWHWHVNSNMPFALAQVELQCFFPSTGKQDVRI
jgi:hypothetical protein